MAEEAEQFLRARVVDQQAQQAFDSKKWLWVPDDKEGFKKATVTEAKGEQVVVQIENGGALTLDADKCYQMNPPKFEKIEDMACLTYLNDASVLENLRQRYYSSLIYTYSGLFCVVINPYRRLPIYTDAVVQMYKGKRRTEMPPHVFSVADNAYCDMLQNHENQSILITGESGAGKTENTKKVIQYLAQVAGSGAKKGQGQLDQQVIQANPVLEAFGNAKTVRNDNSSRFGKFIRIHFGNAGKISGADIEYYLLEKSRVVRQTNKERAYHIFYQLLSGAPNDIIEALLLGRNYADYKFISSSCGTIDSMDDQQEFKSMEEAFEVLGFEKDEKMSLYRTVAAILHLGNIKLRAKSSRDDQAEVADPSDAQKASHLLGIKVDELCKSLVRPRIKVGNEWVVQGRTTEQVAFSISAISMALYERMFRWLVARVNKTLDYKMHNNYFVGVLDIAGFEIFDFNSFEQLCINYTNEKLQQFFNHHMFVLEQEVYRTEGVEWEFIDFGLDLQGTIELIEKPLGILSLLDEECLFPKASDKTYTDKLHQNHEGKSSQYSKVGFTKGNKVPAHFKLHHYAGTVEYNTDMWLDKNRDPLNDNVVDLLKKSSENFMQTVWADRAVESTSRKKGSQFQTVSQIHKSSLNKLMTTLHETQPHFVRCIIPNEMKKPGITDAKLVLHQLHCNGVLEGIRICRKGFPNRLPFQEFRQRYAILAPKSAPIGFMDGRKAAEALLNTLDLDKNEFRVGMTKVFFKAGVLGQLEDERDQKLSRILTLLQSNIRGRLMRAYFTKMHDQRLAIAVIQRNMRKNVFLRNWPWWKLYTKVKPLLNVSRQEDEVRQKDEEITKLKEKCGRLEQTEKDLGDKQTALMEEKQQLFQDLQREQDAAADCEDRLSQLTAAKDNLEQQIQELAERLEEEEDANASISSAKRKLEADLEQRLIELEDIKRNFDKVDGERQTYEAKAKTFGEELEKQNEAVSRLSKDKATLEQQLEETTLALQTEEDKVSRLTKTKTRLEAQVKELLSSSDDQRSDLQSKMEMLHSQTTTAQNEVAEAESKVSQLLRTIKSLEEALEAAKAELETTKAAKADALNKLKAALKDLATASEQLEEEQHIREEVEQKLNKVTSDYAALKQRMETEVSSRLEELENDKRRLASRCSESDAAIADMDKKLTNLERTKQRYAAEIEDLTVNLENAQTASANLDKKQKKIDQSIAEWKGRCENLTSELENAQREARTYSTEVLKLKNDLEEQVEALEGARRDNKGLATEVKDLTERLGEGGKSTHELEKAKKRLEAERDELTEQLEETEGALEQEEGKVLRLQLEIQQIKQDYDRRLLERDEETDAVRKNCQRQLDSMQESIDTETRGKGEQARLKKKLELEFVELQNTCDSLSKTSADATKNAKRLQGQMKDVQAMLEQEQKYREESQAALARAEHKANEISSHVDELRSSNEGIERQLRNAENDVNEAQERAADLQTQMTSLNGAKRRAEQEATMLKDEIEEISTESKMNEERARRLQNEVSRLSTENVTLNESFNSMEKSKSTAERQAKDLQVIIEELEAVGGKKLKSQITKAEAKARDLERDLEAEAKKSSELTKSNRRTERKIKEMQIHLEEEQQNTRRLQDQVTQLQSRAKQLRRQAEEAEEETEGLRAKNRRLQNEADEASSRADEAEAACLTSRARSMTRGALSEE